MLRLRHALAPNCFTRLRQRVAHLSWLGHRPLSSTAAAGGDASTAGGQPPRHWAEDTGPLEVELLSPEDVVVTEGADEDVECFSEAEGNDARKGGAAETISVVDAFARAKVANFINRMQRTSGASDPIGAATAKQLTAEIHEVQSSDGEGDTLFHAKLFLPLPNPYGDRWAEGLAPTAKEAELVAAMHAERIIDALGIPMFLLRSKQQRHAEAARSAGRWAPMPGDEPLPPNTPLPPRLQLLREGAMKAAERELRIDKLEFSWVTAGSFTPMKLTLASPFLMDHGSVYRIKQFFVSYNCLIQRYCRITALHKRAGKVELGSGTAISSSSDSALASNVAESNGGTNELFVAQIKLPIDSRFGERIACGKAPTKKEAYTLACMHAELIIDALGLALYPSCRHKQEIHAAECRKVNRWCCEPDDCEYHYSRASPPPLQLAKGSVDVSSADSAASVESLLMSHSKAIDSFTQVTELHTLVLSARRSLMDYLTEHGVQHSSVISPFFVEALGIKDHFIYRATVTVPVPPVVLEGEDLQSKIGSADEVLPSFVAIGIGTTELEAETAASMHALHGLQVLKRLPSSDQEVQCCEKDQRNVTAGTVMPPPYRYVVCHIGRIMVPGLSPARNLGMEFGASVRQVNSTSMQESQLQRARAEVPESDWSLAPDVEGYIIVSPSTNVHEGHNYVHTVPSVRQADRFAVVRLRDYLERHGKRLESAVRTTVTAPDPDDGLRRWVCKVVLPVPESFGHVVAHGEAYKEDEALVMCAVHAELVLDEIGVAMYDLPLLQKKHSGLASMLGRWATSDRSVLRKGACVPPPVRKEHEKSCLWARLSKEAGMKGRVCDAKGVQGKEVATRNLETSNGPQDCGSTSTGGSMGGCVPSSDVKDDALCDLSKLVSVHPSDVFQNATRLFDNYCRRKGVDLSRIIRQYNVSNPIYGYIHRAIAEIPLPPQFGRRYAVGCATTKKEAYALCCMHAVFTIDALGVPIYSGGKQVEYASNSRVRGRVSPMPGDPLKPPNTESPPGLKSLSDVHKEKPVIPKAPDHKESREPLIWGSYITACRAYLKKYKEHTIYDALFEQRRSPRNGVELEDTGLDVVEGMPLFATAKSQLPRKCAAAGLPPPPPHSFRFEIYGRLPRRRYLVEQPVLGTPFVARGAGDEGHEAVTRAAMHYEYIVGVIGNNRLLKGSADGRREALQSRNSDLFDLSLRDFTPRGKLSIMALYTTLHAPFKPLRVLVKERLASSTRTERIIVTLVEMEDESGLRMTGKGESFESGEESKSRAVAELFKQLQRKSSFQAVTQLFRSHPHLRAEGAAHVVSGEKCFQSLCDALPRKLTSAPPQQTEWPKGLAQIVEGSEARFSSTETQMLLEQVVRELGVSTAPTPLTVPASVRQLLLSMGLTSFSNPKHGLHEGVGKVNPVAIAVVLLSTCVPPPFPSCGGNRLPASGALPLQLAKLLLAGFLLDCQGPCIRLVALVLSSLALAKSGGGNGCFPVYGDEHDGFDLLELFPAEGGDHPQHFTATITSRLKRLVAELEAQLPTDNPLRMLLSSHDIPAAGADRYSLSNGLTTSQVARLRLAIIFASFPRVFVQKEAAGNDVMRQVAVKSKDQQKTLRVRVPSSVVDYFSGMAPDATAGPTAGDDAAASHPHSSLPYFGAFDRVPLVRDARLRATPAVGTFAAPCAVLLASACCSDASALVVADDVPGLALVDGFAPVVARSPEVLTALLELRLAVKLHWGELRPLPTTVQSAVDNIMCAKHSLLHIAQPGLLG